MDRSEILVHISAPSSAVDDARYRAQVEAILNFQSHSRETITLTSPIPEAADPRTIHDPSLLDQAAQQDGSQDDRNSLETPVSVIPDSQPELQQPGNQFESLTLLPVAETTRLSSCIPSKRPRVDLPPLVENSSHENVQGHCDIPAGDRNTNLEHASPTSTTNTLTTPGKGQEKQDDENRIQPPSAEPAAGLEPGPETGPEAEAETSSRPNGRRKGYSPILPSLPLEIRPPPPPISSSPFTTHITPTLEMLSNRLKSPRTYNPAFQTRDLDILERGYWYLRLTIVPGAESEFENQNQTAARTSSKVLCWDKPLFTRFWTFLSDFISKEGRAGWGVWCILEERERDWDRDASGEDTTSAEPIVAQSVSLKVYAWGEIATHIYLLLFLASERRVRKLGAQWRDGRDEVVIQMPESGMGM